MTATRLARLQEGYLPLEGLRHRAVALQIRLVSIRLDPERFRRVLQEEDIEGAELGRRLGLSKTMVSLWLSGARAISTEQALAVAEVVDRDVEDFCVVERQR